MKKLNDLVKTIDTNLSPFKGFIFKLILAALMLQFFLPYFLNGAYEQLFVIGAKLSNRIKDERIQIYALGMVNNPTALYQISLLDERKKHYGSAVRHMEFAIGLLEMHGTERVVIKRYQDRLEALKILEKNEIK